MKPIQGYSDEEWQKVKDVISPALALGAGPQALQPSIELLDQATDDNPHEWTYWYALGDYAQRENDLQLALSAAQEAHRLRPQDPRSLYALATIYWALAAVTPESEMSYALKALRRFERLLQLRIPHKDKQLVRLHIRSILGQFPKARNHIIENTPAPPRKRKPSLFWIIAIILAIGAVIGAGQDASGLIILVLIVVGVIVRLAIRNAFR